MRLAIICIVWLMAFATGIRNGYCIYIEASLYKDSRYPFYKKALLMGAHLLPVASITYCSLLIGDEAMWSIPILISGILEGAAMYRFDR
jgi:hypothetical protein